MRKVDGWQSLAEKPSDHIIDLAARCGNLIMPESSDSPQLATTPEEKGMSDRLNSGDSLAVGGSIPSLDGGFTLTLQADGNLVLYHTGGAPAGWATGTVGRAVTQAIMQADGNFVLYGPAGPIWSTGTHGHPGSYLVVQNDGNVVIYGPGGPLWSAAD
jgi:hypothetical protein